MTVFLIVLLCLLAAGYWSYQSRRITWSQELVLYLTTPDGDITATGVQRFSYVAGLKGLGHLDGGRTHMIGEPLIAKLGTRYLFVGVNGTHSALTRAADRARVASGDFISVIKAMKRHGAPEDVPPAGMPVLLTFDDPLDMTTARIVDPADLEAVFGPGYGVARLTVAVSKKTPDVAQLETVLPWSQDADLYKTARGKGVDHVRAEAISRLRQYR